MQPRRTTSTPSPALSLEQCARLRVERAQAPTLLVIQFHQRVGKPPMHGLVAPNERISKGEFLGAIVPHALDNGPSGARMAPAESHRAAPAVRVFEIGLELHVAQAVLGHDLSR